MEENSQQTLYEVMMPKDIREHEDIPFILVEGKNFSIIFAGRQSHKDLVTEWRQKCEQDRGFSPEFTVKGGGMIQIFTSLETKEKIVYAYDLSGTFGWPSKAAMTKVLKNYLKREHPDWKYFLDSRWP